MSRALDFAASAPWFIQEAALRGILEIAAREHEITPEAIERMRGERLEEGSRTRIHEGGIAVIAVRGPLFRYANLFTAFSGATSMEVLANDVGAALANSKVRGLIFDIDSPGGMVNGLADLAELIYRARGEKPMASFISGLGASAGYYLAAAAPDVLGSVSMIGGSIGTVLEVVDFKVADEKMGVRTIEFVSSQSPNKRMDPFDEDPERRDDARAQLQKLVDDLAQVFVGDMARFRGVSAETVLSDFGQGGVFVGQSAVDAGLVDGLTTMDDLIAEMRDRNAQSRFARATEGRRLVGRADHLPAAGGTDSPPVTPMDEAELMPPIEKQPAGGAEQPVIDRAYLSANHPELVAELATEGASAERDRILGIQALHGPDDVKAECVKDPAAQAGDAALKINAALRASEEAKNRAHLAGRAAAEDDLEAPPPSAGVHDTDDVKATVGRAIALHRAFSGHSQPSAPA